MDIFSGFELDLDDDEGGREWCSPLEYRPRIDSPGWFMEREAGKDGPYMRAAMLMGRGEYEKALETIEGIPEGEQKGAHRFLLFDTLVNIALEVPSTSSSRLHSLLASLHDEISSYGDFIQYQHAALRVYLATNEARQYLYTLCLLCALLDLPDLWLSFTKHPGVTAGSNLRIGSIMKAIWALEKQVEMSKGFIREKMCKQIQTLKGQLTSLNQQSVSSALTDLPSLSPSDLPSSLPDEDDDLSRPVHECRYRLGLIPSPSESDSLVRRFVVVFHWMFEGTHPFPL